MGSRGLKDAVMIRHDLDSRESQKFVNVKMSPLKEINLRVTVAENPHLHKVQFRIGAKKEGIRR